MEAKAEDLMTPKTKLQSYYVHDYEGFQAVLALHLKFPSDQTLVAEIMP